MASLDGGSAQPYEEYGVLHKPGKARAMKQRGKGKSGVVWTLEQVSVANLRTSPIQPSLNAHREDLESRKGQDLLDSIQMTGLRNPIDVERWKGVLTIVEGHRRVAVARKLGWTHIPARIHVPTQSKQRQALRAEIIVAEQTRMTISGAQSLDMFYQMMRLGQDVTVFQNSLARRVHFFLAKRLGPQEHEKLLKEGFSPDIYAAAGRYVRAEQGLPEKGGIEQLGAQVTTEFEGRVLATCLWIHKHKQTKAITTWIDAGRSRRQIARCIEEDRPLIRLKPRKSKKTPRALRMVSATDRVAV